MSTKVLIAPLQQKLPLVVSTLSPPNMKLTTTLLHVAVLCGTALLCNGTTAARANDHPAAKAKSPAGLQVSVDVPPTWRPFLDDDIAEAFASQVQTVLKQRGYAGGIDYVEHADTAAPTVPLLVIHLHEWRIGRTGNAECTFTASLRTAQGEKNLGLVSGTTIFWPHGSRWGLAQMQDTADALEGAAAQALGDLYKRLAETGSVPGLILRK